MKAIVQRVTRASVSVGDEIISSIGPGICVLLGISQTDTEKEVEYMARKLLSLRVFDDDNGKRWNKNVVDKQFEVLCVSQFTLMMTLKGNKPDFHLAMEPEKSKQMYSQILQQMRAAYCEDKVKDGQFGAYMKVDIENDGPVTLPLEIIHK